MFITHTKKAMKSFNNKNRPYALYGLTFGFSDKNGLSGSSNRSANDHSDFEDSRDILTLDNDEKDKEVSNGLAFSEEAHKDTNKSAAHVYDIPAEPDEYSDAYKKVLPLTNKNKKDNQNIWLKQIGKNSETDSLWPANRFIEKYKYGDVSVIRRRITFKRTHIAAKIMFALWIVLSTAAALYLFTQMEQWVIIWWLLNTVIGTGLFIMIAPGYRLKLFPLFLATDVLIAGGLAFLRQSAPEGFYRLSHDIETALSLSANICIGMMVMFYGAASFLHSRARCSYTVEALCLNVLTPPGSNVRYYCPIYEYFYNDCKYIVRPDSYICLPPPDVDGVYKLRINPLYPTDYYDPKCDGRPDIIKTVIGAVWVLLEGAFLCSTMIGFFI